MRGRTYPSPDALSDLLGVLDMRCDISGQLVAGGAWVHRFANPDAVKFCVVTTGACWFQLDGGYGPAPLQTGDVVVTSGKRRLILASDPSRLATATTDDITKDDDGTYRLGTGEDFTMLGGIVRIDADRQPLLLSCLPDHLHVPRARQEPGAIAWLLGQLVAEMRPGGRPGRSLLAAGLTQLLLVHTLRAYVEHAPPADTGWLKGFGDRRLSMALSSMHRMPERDWTLDELAKEAGMSRTSFATRFRDTMGLTPLGYLTEWRMQLATRALRNGASVAQAAASAGYSSESAFSSAFKRIVKVAPGQYRRTGPRAR
ncbi:AraC-type DNA-binding protein [Bordetella sputigena]|uniref:cupin domain-containing protein n=1 Tax=Bordetella sputigena TaxID=1416810 RepID=UPI0039F050AF